MENSFFDVFTVQFIAGSAETALNNPDAVVITDVVAKKYFGNDAPLGQSLVLSDGSLLTVTGVVKGFPPQSHFKFDFLASINAFVPYQLARNKWGEAVTYTYVFLEENVNPSQIEARLKKHVDGLNLEGQPSYSFEPITDIYLHSRATRFALSPHGSAATVYTFALVGGIILLLACMNFINLTTAQMKRRMREIGMRKVLGADRTSLIVQFLLETFGYVIVENFHIESIYKPIQPLVIPFLHGPSSYILIRFKPGPVADQIAAVQRIWSKIVPDYPFKYSFVDEDIEQLYASERRTGKVFHAFAVVAIFIACLGLYGLSFYIGEQKKKEIAIRKVLGCSEGGIVGLILKDIAKLIVVSFLIAAPISYYVMGHWLAEFAYQINLSPYSFLLAGMMAMTIGMFTVSWQAIAAARKNPVDTLKNQ